MKLGSRIPHLCRPLHKLSICGNLYYRVTRHIPNVRERGLSVFVLHPPCHHFLHDGWCGGEHMLCEVCLRISWGADKFSLGLVRCDFLLKSGKILVEFFHLWVAWNLQESSIGRFLVQHLRCTALDVLGHVCWPTDNKITSLRSPFDQDTVAGTTFTILLEKAHVKGWHLKQRTQGDAEQWPLSGEKEMKWSSVSMI